MLGCGFGEQRAWRSLAAAALRFEQSLERLTSTLETAGRDLERARDEYHSLLTAASEADSSLVASTSPAPLTVQERKVALLAAGGRTDAAIAASVHVSVYTVKSHMKSILRKLGLRSRWQLAYELVELRRAAPSLPADAQNTAALSLPAKRAG